MYDAVQLVRSFGLGHTGPASHPFCDIRLLHSGFTLSSEISKTGREKPAKRRKLRETRTLLSGKKTKMLVNGIHEPILIAG
jgi:hypothetical protein